MQMSIIEMVKKDGFLEGALQYGDSRIFQDTALSGFNFRINNEWVGVQLYPFNVFKTFSRRIDALRWCFEVIEKGYQHEEYIYKLNHDNVFVRMFAKPTNNLSSETDT